MIGLALTLYRAAWASAQSMGETSPGARGSITGESSGVRSPEFGPTAN